MRYVSLASRLSLPSTALAAALAVVLAGTSPADARVRGAHGVWAGSKGGHGAFHSVTRRTPGNFARQTTVSGPRGLRTIDTSRSWGNGQYSGTRTATGVNGNTANWNTSGERIAPGQWQGTQTYQGPNGGSYTANGTWTRTPSGSTTSATYTTGSGKTGTYDSALTRNGDGTGYSRNSQATGPNGGTWGKDVMVTRDGQGSSRDVTVTGPQGNQRHWSGYGKPVR